MCDSCSEVSEDSCPPQVVDYPLNEAVEVPDTEGGLFKTVLVEGSGKSPVKGASVTVHYVGTLLDGTPFDSSRDRGEPFVFTLGKGQVIKGWDKGVATMRVGEKSILKCSPEYAYGEAGSPPKIPANSTLLFEVELFDWTCEVDISVPKDHSLMKEVFADGSGYEKPSFESTLRMDVAVYLGPYSEEAIPVWSKKDWSVEVGAVDLPPCLEECLFSMRPGESAAIRVAAHLCTDASPAFGIPEAAQRPDSAAGISYKVELHELKNIKSWDFHGEDKIREGVQRKDKGNVAFKAGHLTKAERYYQRALEFIGEDYGFEGDLQAECRSARVLVLGNLAQVLLMNKKYTESIENSNKILALEERNVKALFRLAKAKDGLQEWDEALQAVEKILSQEASNADAVNLKAKIVAERKAYEQKMKSSYKRMFA